MKHFTAAFACLLVLRAVTFARGEDSKPAPIPDAPTIAFLTKTQAGDAIVQEKLEPYFSLLTPLDMAAKTGSALSAEKPEDRLAEVKERYRAATLDFTDKEKQLIESAIKALHPTLTRHYPLLARTQWSLIKKSHKLEGGAHFTREAHIVLSEQFTSAIVSRKDKPSQADLSRMILSLMLHEQCHVIQRLEPKLFAKMYGQLWQVERAGKIESCKWLDDRQVVNPDGVDVNWVVPIEEGQGDGKVARVFWPRIILKATEGVPVMFKDMEMVLIDLEKTEAGYRVKLRDDGTPQRTLMQQSPAFLKRFPHGNAYHPNEAAAAMIPAVILADAFATLPRPGASDPTMIEYEQRCRKWLREHLK